MSKNSKPVDKYRLKIGDGSDSYHSFAASKSNNDDLDNLSTVSEDNTLTDEFELELATDADDSSSSTCNKLAKKFNIPKFGTFSRDLNGNHHLVPKPRSDSPMPGMELFDMQLQHKEAKQKKQKEKMENDKEETEALQKFAFTEIWVERQLNNPERKRKFTSALDDYFLKENTKGMQKLSMEEQEKGAFNRQLFVDPPLSTSTSLGEFKTLPSLDFPEPFKACPDEPIKEKQFPGQKSYITVPAGYDLTNLVEYKDPNHWHRRSTTRNDNEP